MVPKTQAARTIVREQPRRSPGDAAEVLAIGQAARELAARLSWLPGSPPSDTFSKRCHKLTATFKSVFARVETAFAQAPDSEDLLWLRNNAQQLASAARGVANELVPQATLPVVSNKIDILPRVLAIAEGFLNEVDAGLPKEQFAAFCLAFEETTPLEFHEIGALVPALKLVLLEQIAARGTSFVNNPTSNSSERVVPLIRTLQHVTQTSWKDELEGLIRNINRTNSTTVMADGRTLTDALAERDVLRLRYSMLKASADAASGAQQQAGFMRATRSELKFMRALDVRDLRQQASDVARRARELDARVQEVNWTSELLEAS